ncbi:MAG: exopolysaccharide biosynthesis protein [Alphaproteobacteria bacterium]|nr:exopolysaccharide biosynthesis protein [Alphaproteobacteria bacterium]
MSAPHESDPPPGARLSGEAAAHAGFEAFGATDAASEHPASTSAVLEMLSASIRARELTLDDLMAALSDRALGLLLLILALPCAIPFLYGVPQIVAIPMLFVAAHVVLGRHHLWLPPKLRERTLSAESFRTVVRRGLPWIRRLEFFARPRFAVLTHGTAQKVVGVFLFAFCCVILVPLPATNTVPGIAVAIVALGFIERDGLLVVAGSLLGTAWITMLLTVGTVALHALVDLLKGLV